MIGVRIHQLLHGYRRGHELLAASMQLDPRDADLVTRLSDLSGTLTTESEFHPYLTTYPLPSGEFYALAKTWLDHNAPRPGCVLTHTLLVPTGYWASKDDPLQFASLFLFPSSRDVEGYKIGLNPPGAKPDQRSPLHPPPPELGVEFVHRYFSEGLRPLVWFGDPNADDIAWQILQAIWPRLRAQFACCTLSLQPRFLEQEPFDLMFAPSTAYSRFHKFSREHIIDATAPPTSALNRDVSREAWCGEWAALIFGNIPGRPTAAISNLAAQLGQEPTAIRRLFLIEELRKRISDSPTAAVGVMDVVESLAPDSASAVDYKRDVIFQALRAASLAIHPEESIKCLFLISERLRRAAFSGVGPQTAESLSSTVVLLASKHPDIALESAESLFAQSIQFENSAFATGLLLGLRELASTTPSQLRILRRFPSAASSIIAREPIIAAGYLHSVAQRTADPITTKDLAGWIASVENVHARKGLRDALFPELKSDQDAPIVAELLKDLPASEVSSTLDLISHATNGFAGEGIGTLLEEHVSRVHPGWVRKWGATTHIWSNGIASLLAASYTPDLGGLRHLLSGSQLSSKRQAHVIAIFLHKIGPEQFPLWFREHARESPDLLVQLLAAGPETTAEVSRQVHRVLEEVRDIPIAKAEELVHKIEPLSELMFFRSLTDAAMQNVVRSFVRGDISSAACELWQRNRWAQEWLSQVPESTLQSLLTHGCRNDMHTWLRAWRWLRDAPTSLHRRHPSVLPGLVDGLVSAHRSGWCEDVTECWIAVLKRTASEAQDRSHLRLCAQALKFAFFHDRYPLGSLVAAAFYDVYQAVTREHDAPTETAELFSIFDWDKGKQLRRQLVDSFFRSDWPPGQLALAARDTALLRKIFKRIMRKWGGEKYISAMLKDLAGRREPAEARLHDELAKLASNPNFYEEWD